MRPTIRTAALSASLALAAALTASAAWAQAGAPQDAAHGPRRDAQHGGDMRARMEAMRQAREQQHAQDLRTILRLRPDQEPALTAFLAAHKRQDQKGGGPEGRRGPPDAPPAPPGAMTTPQRLDQEDRRMAEMTARRQQHEAALRTFYAALSPDQRQVFDALQRMQHGHGGFGHRGGHGFGHGFAGPGFGRFGGPPPGPPGRGDE